MNSISYDFPKIITLKKYPFNLHLYYDYKDGHLQCVINKHQIMEMNNKLFWLNK